MRQGWLVLGLVFAVGCPGLSTNPPQDEDMSAKPADMSDMTPDTGKDTGDATPDMMEDMCDDCTSAVVGNACEDDTACGDGFCATTTFPGGYCTQECTEGDPDSCPAGSGCINLSDKGTCFLSCTKDEDCREGYECFSDSWCFPKQNKPEVPVGAACTTDDECGEGYCSTELPGGYCTVKCDLNNLCPDNASCFEVEADASVCFQKCTRDADCREGYICDSDDTCYLEPTTEDLFDGFSLYAPCGTDLWAAWTSTKDFSLESVELRDDMDQVLLSRTLSTPRMFTSGNKERVALFEGESLSTDLTYTLRLGLSGSQRATFQSQAADQLPPGTDNFEVRASEVRAGELSVTLRPGVDGKLTRATLFDANHCRLEQITLDRDVTRGTSAPIVFPGTYAASTTYQIILEGVGLVDTLSLTTAP